MKSILIDRAIIIAGSQQQLAARINSHLVDDEQPVSQPRISQWLNGKEPIPTRMVVPLEKASKGEITAYQWLEEISQIKKCLKSQGERI